MKNAINNMVNRIVSIIGDCKPSIYLYGSVVLDDFKMGWSDIDILVLTGERITEPQANELVGLRESMLVGEPNNPYYRSFEGGMLTLDAFVSGKKDTVVYWGTSGERITDKYHFDSFSMTELLESGRLLRICLNRWRIKYWAGLGNQMPVVPGIFSPDCDRMIHPIPSFHTRDKKKEPQNESEVLVSILKF